MQKFKENSIKANKYINSIVRLFKTSEGTLILAILLIMFFLGIFTKSFFTAYNISNLLRQSAILGIIGIASLIVIISGGIDLSVGAICGLSSMVLAVLLTTFSIPIYLSIIVSIVVGTLVGLYNGVIIYETRIPPFIATLGSMTIVQGVIKLLSGGKTVTNLPLGFTRVDSLSFLGIHFSVYIWIFIGLFTYFVLNFTRFGRNIFTIGSSMEVARLSGINLRKNIYAVYSFAGFLCAIAGVLLTLRLYCAVPTGGEGYNLNGIAAAVIGGASLNGATGSVQGAILGALLVTLIRNGGVHLGITPFVMEIVTGALITVAVILDKIHPNG